ncbi:hypothetical protein Sru01_51440 [Sphaerisporangium rufum]|uniref:Major facilitator superfamily (MFS) profile domain-containing protein n=1 Tax=Sphaerisporangium rufum TaxID=1381558 RepID=A0A919R5N9_9ACTN|nr:MFS transporter [Sphaerisporangium rufum]GII80162.1 hypothetical protein Sru01_51440 [Sphaerisporangium rufum]
MPTTAGATALSRRLRAAALPGATAAYFVAIGMTLPATPRFVAGPLGGDPALVGAAAAVFSVVSLLVRLPLARRIGRWPRRAALSGAAGLLAAAIAAHLGIGHAVPLLSARAVAGAADGVFLLVAVAAADQDAAEGRRAAAVSRLTLMVYGGLLAGPVAAELLQARFGLAVVWAAAAAAGVVATALAAAVPQSRPEAADRADRTGRSARAGWVPRGAVGPAVVCVLVTAGPVAFGTFVGLYVLGTGRPGAALELGVCAAGTLAGRALAGPRLDRLDPVAVTVASVAATGAALLLLSTGTALVVTVAAALLLAAGQSVAFPALTSLALRAAPPHDRLPAIAAVTAAYDVGFVLSGLGLGVLGAAAGLPVMFAAAGLVALAALGAVPALRRAAPRRARAAGGGPAGRGEPPGPEMERGGPAGRSGSHEEGER